MLISILSLLELLLTTNSRRKLSCLFHQLSIFTGTFYLYRLQVQVSIRLEGQCYACSLSLCILTCSQSPLAAHSIPSATVVKLYVYFKSFMYSIWSRLTVICLDISDRATPIAVIDLFITKCIEDCMVKCCLWRLELWFYSRQLF